MHKNIIGQTRYLFFSHLRCIQLAKRYLYNIVIDCTYETNSFRMSMLDIVGVTNSTHPSQL